MTWMISASMNLSLRVLFEVFRHHLHALGHASMPLPKLLTRMFSFQLVKPALPSGKT